MARFHIRRRCPLIAQFWFLGLDARQGNLTLRGFCKTPTSHGSSLYTLDGLSLHSAGLTLLLSGEPLHFNRRTQTFTRGGRTVPATEGRLHLRAALHTHETWIAARHGAAYREGLVILHRPPRPVMGALDPWRAFIGGLPGMPVWGVTVPLQSASGSRML